MRRLGVAARSRPPIHCPGEDVCVRSRNGVPVRLEWRERVLPVLSVEASWSVESRWWLDSSRYGTKRRYFRVCVHSPTGNTLCLELFCSRNRETSTNQWRVWRVAD